MPYLIVTSIYPTETVNEVVKVYLEAIKKYPPDDSLGTEVVPSAVKTTHQGVQAIAISEIKKGKFEDAMTRSSKVMAMFNNIPGFEYTIEYYATVAEGLENLGVSIT